MMIDPEHLVGAAGLRPIMARTGNNNLEPPESAIDTSVKIAGNINGVLVLMCITSFLLENLALTGKRQTNFIILLRYASPVTQKDLRTSRRSSDVFAFFLSQFFYLTPQDTAPSDSAIPCAA